MIMQMDLEALTLTLQKLLTDSALDYLQERGIQEDTITQFRIGYDPGVIDHYFERRIVFPVVNADGTVVELIGRAIDHREPKYKVLLGEENTFFNHDVLAKAEDLILCQSVFDVITLHQAGIAAICLANIRFFKESHAQLLDKHRVFICLGNDDAGRRESTRILEIMEAQGHSGMIIRLPEGVRDVNDFFLRVEDPTQTFVGLIMQAVETQLTTNMTADAAVLTAYTEEYAKQMRDDMLHYWSSGFESLDEWLGGGIRNGLYLWTGGTQAGKTMLLKRFADAVALQGTPVLFLTWDVSGYDLWLYSLSRIIGVPFTVLQRGEVDTETVNEANKIYQTIGSKLWTMECKLETSTEDVSGAVERIVLATGQTPVIIVDQMLRFVNPTQDPYGPEALTTLGYVFKQWSQLWDTAIIVSMPIAEQAPTMRYSSQINSVLLPPSLFASCDWVAEVHRRPHQGWRIHILKNRFNECGSFELDETRRDA
jgi:replicative DNA helicase